MLLREIMTPNPECISPDDTLQSAAQRMKALDVGSLPICDNDRLAGMITDRDITIRAVAEGRDPSSTKVRDAMTPEVVYCFEDQDVDEAARMMSDKQLRRLLVLNRDKRLVGIVAQADVATHAGDRKAGDLVEAISEPAHPRR